MPITAPSKRMPSLIRLPLSKPDTAGRAGVTPLMPSPGMDVSGVQFRCGTLPLSGASFTAEMSVPGGQDPPVSLVFGRENKVAGFRTSTNDGANTTSWDGAVATSGDDQVAALGALPPGAGGGRVYVILDSLVAGLRITPAAGAFNANAAVMTADYLMSDQSWTPLAVTDGTDVGGVSLAQAGDVTFTWPDDIPRVFFWGSQGYVIRLSFSAALSDPTNLDLVQAIAMPGIWYPVGPFPFSGRPINSGGVAIFSWTETDPTADNVEAVISLLPM